MIDYCNIEENKLEKKFISSIVSNETEPNSERSESGEESARKLEEKWVVGIISKENL